MKRLLGLAFALSACTGMVDKGMATGDDTTAGVDAGVTPMPDATAVNEVIARAQQWVDAKVPYCQAPNHKKDLDADCASTCTRPDVPEWDPYRSDCSGFVSWAWGLPAPGHVTDTFAPMDTSVSKVIMAEDLQPGDAANNDTHIVLFKAWTKVGTEATFMEEPGCSSATPYAREFTATVTLDGSKIVIKSHGTFTAIRYAP